MRNLIASGLVLSGALLAAPDHLPPASPRPNTLVPARPAPEKDKVQGKIGCSPRSADHLGLLQQLGALLPTAALPPAAPEQQGPAVFIDRFVVPPAGQAEFRARMNSNRRFIRQLPGFVADAAYEHSDEQANLVCITIAKWASPQALEQAKAAVQAHYRQQGFQPAEMMARLHISLDRAMYHEVPSAD